MHYPKKAFGKGKVTLAKKGCPDCPLGQRNGFTPLDIKGLNDLYDCSERYIGETMRLCETEHNKDSRISCPRRAKQGHCKGRYEGFMKRNCFKSCYCTGK